MGYAYLDRSGILHISASKKIAATYSKNGKAIATEQRAQNGCPIVDGMRVFMYSADKIYIGGNATTGKELSPETVPGLVELYKALM